MKRTYTGLNDAKGIKLYNGDLISFEYEDKCEETGKGLIIGKIVFENGAFVVKDIEFTGYDWNEESLRPELLWNWLKGEVCHKYKPTRNPQPATRN